MSDPKLYPDVYAALGREYPRMSADQRADLAASIFASGLASRDALGRVVFDARGIEAIAPRLGAAPAIPGDHADAATKIRAALQWTRRSEHTPPQPAPRPAAAPADYDASKELAPQLAACGESVMGRVAQARIITQAAEHDAIATRKGNK
jgi:hypothetical protein